MKKYLKIKLLNIFSFATALYINYLSVAANLGGKTIRELSDKYDNLFTPSSQTFSIWGLIYALIMIFLVIQFFKKFNPLPVTQNLLFSLSCLFNAGWILLWQFEYIAGSVLAMLGLLTTLAIINKQLSKEGPWLFKLIFGVYLGWICIATVANITALLVAKGVAPTLEIQAIVTISILVIATALTGWLMRKLVNPYLFVSVSWAFYGVYSKRVEDYPIIAYAAIAALSVVVVLALLNNPLHKKVEKV
jgi:benzodiazapine receptor